jgi:putative intracellular protease/amidase
MRKLRAFTTMVVMMAAVISLASPFSLGPAIAFGQTSSKVLMVPREGPAMDIDLAIKMEVGVMTKLLKDAGFEVDIATASGNPILGPTQKIENVVRLSEINVDNYVGVIMPCMHVGAYPGPPVSPEAIAVVRKALSDGKPVAAAAHASTILAEAGVLKGKKYAFSSDPTKDAKVFQKGVRTWRGTDPRFNDAIYSGTGVVQDGKIITSGYCPTLEKIYVALEKQYPIAFRRVPPFQDRTVELTQKFIAAIGAE